MPSDVVRFFLAYDRPENEQTNFTLGGTKVDAVERAVGGKFGEAWLVSLDEKLATEAQWRAESRSFARRT